MGRTVHTREYKLLSSYFCRPTSETYSLFFMPLRAFWYNTLTFGSPTALLATAFFVHLVARCNPKLDALSVTNLKMCVNIRRSKVYNIYWKDLWNSSPVARHFSFPHSYSVAAAANPRHFGASQIAVARPNILKIMYHMQNLTANRMVFSKASEPLPNSINGFR